MRSLDSLLRSLAPLTALTLALGCTASDGQIEPDDTNTNWLKKCSEPAECKGQYRCLCGVCTLPCENRSDCAGTSSEALCLPAEDECSEPSRLCLLASTTEPLLDAGQSSLEEGGVSPSPDAGPGLAGSGTTTDGGPVDGSGGASGGSSGAAGQGPVGGGGSSTEAPICPLSSDAGHGAVREQCAQGEVCCTCGCGEDTEACLAELACPPKQGPGCGVDPCREGYICCDREQGLCAADETLCPGGVATAPMTSCIVPTSDRESELRGIWSGTLEFTQLLDDQQQTMNLEVSLEFGAYAAPVNHLAALGFVGDWAVYSSPIDEVFGITSLLANAGEGEAWAYNRFEADGPANSLTMTESCFQMTRTSLEWDYVVSYAVTDLIDYGLYDYLEPGTPVVVMSASEKYEIVGNELEVDATSEGMDGERPVSFSMSGTLLRE